MNSPNAEQPADALIAEARELAQRHVVSDGPAGPVHVWSGIQDMSGWLAHAREAARQAPAEAAKAAEWLLDNDYQVRRAIRQVRQDLPAGFYARLPAVSGGESTDLPRVFLLAHGLLRASRLQPSLDGAERFITAYQSLAPLTIGELWAFPTMLRIACLEILVCTFTGLLPGLKRVFEYSAEAAASDGFEDAERASRTLAAINVVASIPWKDFFDRVSLVEDALKRDPSGFYARMDFATRDRYRGEVEDLARGSDRGENEVVAAALELSERAGGTAPESHVGYWLVDEGRHHLEMQLDYRPGPGRSLGRWALRHAGLLYAAGLSGVGLVGLAIPLAYMAHVGADMVQWLLGIALLLLPASILAVTVVHWLVTLLVPSRVLPKLDFERGIPDDCRTAVVVPVIIADSDEVPALMERLEAYRLTNADSSLNFVLLSDHVDAQEERLPNDEKVEQALVDGIRRLNRHYGAGGSGPFHLLHRQRLYNSRQGCWMGWERKRGKLEEFNRFVLGTGNAGFRLQEGTPEALRGSRFVVTVDADTHIPHGVVARLVGTLAHPLNRTRFAEANGKVTAGYTVVQPRVEVAPERGLQSRFARFYAGDTAIDIYSRAVSDVYQDLFGSGIFIGKGIYEVDAFHRNLIDKVPDNALVSHDLFEGVLGRTALASDIVFYEGFPASYAEYTRRWHRWVRGDWQLLPWLFPRVPTKDGYGRNRLSALGRWQIFDNLRRSVLPLGLVALAVAGWLILPGNPWIWTALTVAAPGAHAFTDLTSGLARGCRRRAFRSTLRQSVDHLGRWFLGIVFLVHDAVVALDAIARTLWRLFVSRRRLLEWTTAAHTALQFANAGSRANAWSQMRAATIFSAVLTGSIALLDSAALPPALPLLLLWLMAPEIAAFVSRPPPDGDELLGAEERARLRRFARRTWLYFETFVGPDDQWLPPDNHQEAPHLETARRTSPTNIGMMLLSTQAASDLGYIGTNELGTRLRNSFDALDQLQTYRGHLLNWYDTTSLEPLEPRYISTVDSGNLAMSLLAIKHGCLDASRAPLLRAAQWQGIVDTLAILDQSVAEAGDGSASGVDEIRTMLATYSSKAAQLDDDGDSGRWAAHLAELENTGLPALEAATAQAFITRDDIPTATLRDTHVWLDRLHHHVKSMARDMRTFRPWETLLSGVPAACSDLASIVARNLPQAVPVAEVGATCARLRRILGEYHTTDDEAASWTHDLDAALETGARAHQDLTDTLAAIAARAERLAFAMDFRFLYDREMRLFRIGYNLSADRIDPNHYDLLASEARLASIFAIAKGDVPVEHWFHLGRPLRRTSAGIFLVSWNGSMFEYLMPPLLLRSHPDTLLGRSERGVVATQRDYARRFDMPWGTSEAAYAARDVEHRYRYRAFGTPGLGLRRGLALDLVVAPYASALALAVHPHAALDNLIELERLGGLGQYGFLEALDYTEDRRESGAAFAPVNAYMAHHQGMILAAINNAVNAQAHVRRLHADPRMKSVEILLQERVPRDLTPEIIPSEAHETVTAPPEPAPPAQPWTPRAGEAFPQLLALGNGNLSSWITEAGGGGLWWHGKALTRWRPDTTGDHYGLRIYVCDDGSGVTWPVGRQPPDQGGPGHVTFNPHMAEFRHQDGEIGIHMEVAVATSDDVEIRRLTVVNHGDEERTLRFTSFAEVVLASANEDERHPAFSKLFVGGEFLADLDGLLFERRPRHPEETPPVLLHRVITSEAGVELTGYDCDRAAVLGRHGSVQRPRGVADGLLGTTGWTLDPAMALQVRLVLPPGETREFAFLTMAAGSREAVQDLAARYATLSSLAWAIGDATNDVARELQELGVGPRWMPDLQLLGSLLLYPHPTLRADPRAIVSNRLGQPRLWTMGISGDHPILLLRMSDTRKEDLLELLIRAHELWRRRGIPVDLVVLCTAASGYSEPLRDQFLKLLRGTGTQDRLGRHAGIHLVFADHIARNDCTALEAVARVILDGSEDLGRQLASAIVIPTEAPVFRPTDILDKEVASDLRRPTNLLFDNGLGGFEPEHGDYLVHLEAGVTTPAPWANVLANDDFGTIVTEAGLGFSWAINSGENRLTQWSNDPVADTPGEALYLRDEETAEIWTPTPRPAGRNACQIRHGTGYTVWHTRSRELEQELAVFVAPDDPVKVVRLRIRNLRRRERRITATYYAEWVLGGLASQARPSVVCGYEPAWHALTARNPWNPDFGDRVAFLGTSLRPHSLTTDRQVFLGRDGDLAAPAALHRWDLGGRVHPGADPCAALQVHLDIAPADSAEVVFVLGQGDDAEHAMELVRRWRDPTHVELAFTETTRRWQALLGAVQVRTPDRSFDLMINRWLPYQVTAARLMARAGFHQASGGIGFRDQLQDVMALLHSDPDRARAHILTCAAHQFEEGDVLHWWHPPQDRGVRTRCSDDLLWLVYVTSSYVAATGDTAILDEKVEFLCAPPLAEDEDERYGRFETTSQRHSLFEHCYRAMERGATQGVHGLPLIGAGDWNDGMNRIGRQMRGESVWLAWFSIATMNGFADLATRVGRDELSDLWTERARSLAHAVEEAGWDGKWYVRAFDDDGRPWGAAENDECRIDLIAQSWAVLSGAAAPDRASRAVEAATAELVRPDEKLVCLLAPPFDRTPRDPGYIKAYPPGIRENGGQYSHAAAWLGCALADLGDGARAARIFSFLNPINHTLTAADVARYRAEPYVIAGDVAGAEPHLGRGGWTWYTGSAAWTWRLGIERILGLRLVDGKLGIDPRLPDRWPGFEATVKGPNGTLAIRVDNSEHTGKGVIQLVVDGTPVEGQEVAFPTDGSVCQVRVHLGTASRPVGAARR